MTPLDEALGFAELAAAGLDEDIFVTDAEALDDQQFFEGHPGRRYHRRPAPDGSVWLIRRRGRAVHLRTRVRTGIACPDTDEALRQAWFEAAWPAIAPVLRVKLIKAVRTAERAKKATRP